MSNSKSINELLLSGAQRLTALKDRSRDRATLVECVRAAVPRKLAGMVQSAGVDGARLTIGVASASWASRLRYLAEVVRSKVEASSGIPIKTVRIRVVPPRA